MTTPFDRKRAAHGHTPASPGEEVQQPLAVPADSRGTERPHTPSRALLELEARVSRRDTVLRRVVVALRAADKRIDELTTLNNQLAFALETMLAERRALLNYWGDE